VEAYGLLPYQVFGGPGWLDVTEYDIEAKAGGPAGKEQLALMLRAIDDPGKPSIAGARRGRVHALAEGSAGSTGVQVGERERTGGSAGGGPRGENAKCELKQRRLTHLVQHA
jgi:hypothetical protein